MKRYLLRFFVLALFALNVSCGSAPMDITPGKSIGPLQLGMTFTEVKNALKQPPYFKLTFNRVGTAFFVANGISAVFSSNQNNGINDNATLIAIGCKKGSYSSALKPGLLKEQVEDLLGAPQNQVGQFAYYDAGVSIKYKDDKVEEIGVFQAFSDLSIPPEMTLADS